MGRCISMMAVLILAVAIPTSAATYYVNFDAGSDAANGLTPGAAFKHCPGDRNATGAARKVKLRPGDLVRFKGGVVYRGAVDIRSSGLPDRPICFDGNADGGYGDGPAVIDGSQPLTDLRPCRTAAEADGAPHYRHIYWTTVPKGVNWRLVNLCQGEEVLPIAQDPNPIDPIFQEDPAFFVKTGFQPPRTETDLHVRYLSKADETGNRPLISMFDDSAHSAVIQDINSGGEIEIETPRPVTAVELAMTPMARYTSPKEVSFRVGGAEILRARLANHPDKCVEQRFKLPRPVTFTKLVVKFLTAHPRPDGRVRNWGAVRKIAAYNAEGVNVLRTERRSVLTHEGYFTQTDPHHFDNALLALYASPAAVYYKRILEYDPARHRIRFQTLGHGEKPYERGGAFSIVNNIRHIDRPGEYAVRLDAEPDGRHKIFVWPPRLTDGEPKGLTYGRFSTGFSCQRASHVVLRGFLIRKQGWNGSNGVTARGPAKDLRLLDLTVTRLRGSGVGIHTNGVDNVLVAGCRALDNAGHTKGILLRRGKNLVVRDCTLKRNTSTALDFYTVDHGAVRGCLVADNRGMHANGLTFYVGCRNILVEGNTVRRGNAALTCQDGENMIIRNNILSGAPAIGLWNGRAFNNIVITNNILRFEGDPAGASAAIYGGNGGARGYTIANNICDGLSGNVLRKAELRRNIFTTYGPVLSRTKLGDNLHVEDLSRLFVDADAGDYRPVAGSPAVDAGVALGQINALDADGAPRQGSVDIGPYEFLARGAEPRRERTAGEADQARFSLGGYTIGPPTWTAADGYESLFQPDPAGHPLAISALTVTGEGGGRSSKRTGAGFILNWDHGGHWLEWTIENAEAGPYELVIDHASEMPSVRRFFLNGRPVEGLDAVAFGATGSWRIFEPQAMPAALTLEKGRNVLRVMNVRGSLNFRTLTLIPVRSAAPGEPHLVKMGR